MKPWSRPHHLGSFFEYIFCQKPKIMRPRKESGKANKLYFSVFGTSDHKRLSDLLTEENAASYSSCMIAGTSHRTSECFGGVCVWAHVGHIPPIFSCAGWLTSTFSAHVVAVTKAGTSCPKFHWPAIKSLLFWLQEMTGLTLGKDNAAMTAMKGMSHHKRKGDFHYYSLKG